MLYNVWRIQLDKFDDIFRRVTWNVIWVTWNAFVGFIIVKVSDQVLW